MELFPYDELRRAKQDADQKGEPDGYASLDETGKVPVDQLPPIGGGGPAYLNAVALSSFEGANDDAKLTAAMAALSALSKHGVSVLLDEQRDYTFTQQQTLYSGFSIVGQYRPVDQPRASQTVANQILLNISGGTVEEPKGWFKINSGSTFGCSFQGLSISGNDTSGFIHGSNDTGGVLWTTVFRDVSMANGAFCYGTPTNKLLMTACTFDGYANVNNVKANGGGIHVGGSDIWFNNSIFLLDSPRAMLASSAYLARFDFLSNTWIKNLYCTAEGHSAIEVLGSSTAAKTVYLLDSVLEGRNAGSPTDGALVRVTSGRLNMQNCRLAYAMADPSATGRNDAGVLHVVSGRLDVNNCTYTKATAVSTSTPLIYASGGKVRVRNIITEVDADWAGPVTKPIVKQAVAGLIDADDTVTLVTAQTATPVTSSTARTNSGTTLTIDKPSGVADGDFLVAAVFSRNGDFTTPAGWTLAAPSVDSTAPGYLRYYYKSIPSAAAEVATTYTWTAGSSGRLLGIIARISGADPADFPEVTGAMATAITTPWRVIQNGVTTTRPYTLLLSAAAASSAGGLTYTFSNVNQTAIASIATNVGGGGSESSMSLLFEIVPTASATGTRSTPASDPSATGSGVGYMFAVNSLG